MTEQQLSHFQQLLNDEEARLQLELETIAMHDPAHPNHLEPKYPETGDTSDEGNAAEVTEYADELSIEARLEAELRDVRKALETIQQGSYGICKYCQKEIDPKRLEARPASSSCIDCKKLLTQEM